MSDIKSVIPNVAEDLFGKEGKYIAEAALYIIDITKNVKKARKDKMKVLNNKEYDMSYQYNEVILKNFIPRVFRYYGSQRKISIKKIKDEVESRRYFTRNIILTGQAGVGKTMVLKWLFLHSNVPESRYILIYAKMFDDCESLDEVLEKIENLIPNDRSCIVFFDGLDELKCINGNEYEFNKFINFFDRRSKYGSKEINCKFIISTRPEHFGFNNKIIKRNSDISIDNYAVYELLTLTKKEIFRICKSIKKIYEFDKKVGLKNFIDKWPSDKKGEVEFIKYLNNYLDNVDENSSLLNIPLFCRYAYQIIYNWKSLEKVHTNNTNMTQSERIQEVLGAYIKWEFHDRYRYQTAGKEGKGKHLLDEYKNQVLEYLTELVGKMENNEFISRQRWEEFKSVKDIHINIALCALQEDESGDIKFIHNTFRNYFLARYYVSYQLNNEDSKNLSILLRKNSEFSILYVEQMMKSSNTLVGKICNYLLTQQDMDSVKLSEYARGNRRLIYEPLITFTIEEYLSVFPEGVFVYAGINFNKYIMDNLKFDGILKTMNDNSLEGCNQQIISRNMYIKRMQYNQFIPNRYFLSFYTYEPTELKFISAYFHAKKISQEQIKALLFQDKISYETILNNSNIRNVLDQVENDENEYLKFEKERLRKIFIRMINFLGGDKKYWCLMNEDSVRVYMMVPENEGEMKNLFIMGKSKYPIEYACTYGNYIGKTLNMETIVQAGYNYTIDNLSFVFNAGQSVLKSSDFFNNYYSIHYRNKNLLKKRMDMSSIYIYEDARSNLFIYEVFELYKSMEEYLEKPENEKLKLYYSDEKLLTFYALAEGEKMVNLAQDTLLLCEFYQHTHGLKFREFLLSDDTSFIGNDLQKVYEYSEKYIWI